MALTKVTGQVINDSTGLVVGVTTVGGGLSATDGFFSGIVTAVGDASFSGNVSVGGTLTYEDVTNIDAVGLVTARNGIVVGSGITLSKDGDGFFTGIVTATSFKGDGSNLTGITNATTVTIADESSDTTCFPLFATAATGDLAPKSGTNLTFNSSSGALTATSFAGDGSALTGIGGTDFIHAEQVSVSGVTTSQAFIPSQGQLSHRNILINGDMNIAQRGTSSTSVGYKTCDRWYFAYGGENETPTQAQANLSSSDTPYSFGFRKSYKITNGNQTSTDAADYLVFYTVIEAQDLAQSGWNYTSSSSYITLSFWAKSSVTKTFDVKLTTSDGTAQQFNHQFALSANTWKKVEIPIPGNSNITINNDNGKGVEIQWDMYSGTNYTSGSTVDQWVTYNGNTSAPDETADWWTTNDATFELTGVQLEVGQVATPFEHRSFADELTLCHRYYFKLGKLDYLSTHMSANEVYGIGMSDNDDQNIYAMINFPVKMRIPPTAIDQSGSAADYQVRRDTTKTCTAVPNFVEAAEHYCRVNFPRSSHGWGTGQMLWCMSAGSSGYLGFSAEY